MKRIPLIGQIAAGQPIDCAEYYEGYTCVDPAVLRGRDGFALRVKGDSMIGDRIYNGDIVVVVMQPEVLPSDIAVVRIDRGAATLKRVKKQGDFCILSPSNPSMEPILVPAKDVEVVGKVVEVKFQLS
nr:S24 family peptidase [Paenibacillus alvei]